MVVEGGVARVGVRQEHHATAVAIIKTALAAVLVSGPPSCPKTLPKTTVPPLVFVNTAWPASCCRETA